MKERFENDLWIGVLNSDVVRLQRFLQDSGYATFSFSSLPVGIFGPKTQGAVKEFQIKNNIIPTSGFFGPKTRAVVNKIVSQTNRERIFITANSCLGIDASPSDIAPDEYGCAETVTEILRKSGVDMPVLISTYRLYTHLASRGDFTAVDQPLPGDIIISPTGLGNGNLPNGHVGIVAELGEILSNSSKYGIFINNFTIDSWRQKYEALGGYPCYFFRKL